MSNTNLKFIAEYHGIVKNAEVQAIFQNVYVVKLVHGHEI
jgi:hypothetical protein